RRSGQPRGLDRRFPPARRSGHGRPDDGAGHGGDEEGPRPRPLTGSPGPPSRLFRIARKGVTYQAWRCVRFADTVIGDPATRAVPADGGLLPGPVAAALTVLGLTGMRAALGAGAGGRSGTDPVAGVGLPVATRRACS